MYPEFAYCWMLLVPQSCISVDRVGTMPMPWRAIFKSIVAGALGLAIAATASAQQVSAVRALMEESGLVRQSAGSGEGFKRLVLDTAEEINVLPDEYVGPLADISGESLQTERYLRDLESALTEVLTDEQITSMRQFYASPLGQRALQAELAGSTAEVVDEINSTGEKLRAMAKRDSVRTALMRRMDEHFYYSEASADWFATAALVVAEAAVLARSREEDPAESLAAARLMINLARPDRVDIMRAQTEASFTRIYRDLSTSDLEAYVKFLEAGPAAEFYAAYYAVDRKLGDQRIEEIRARFAEYARQKKA
jgi:hypothetical protein